MARQQSARREWTPAQIKTLRQGAGKRSAISIGRELNRSPGAIRQKGHSMGLSLKVKTTAKKTTRGSARRPARNRSAQTRRQRTLTPRTTA